LKEGPRFLNLVIVTVNQEKARKRMNWKTLAQNRAAIKKNVLIVGIDIAKKWHVANEDVPRLVEKGVAVPPSGQ
jgi:hypothetical protein